MLDCTLACLLEGADYGFHCYEPHAQFQYVYQQSPYRSSILLQRAGWQLLTSMRNRQTE